MTDATDDKIYEGLDLKTFLRHFVPQVDKQNEEISKINESKFLPYLDATMPETLPKEEPKKYISRQERRQAERKEAKKGKK